MRPEDIDDLFKKKLGDFHPSPSADAWQRLQEQLQPEKKKNRVIPMWWSVAASVAFLILVGTFFYTNLTNPRPELNRRPVAQVHKPAVMEQQTKPETEGAVANQEQLTVDKQATAETQRLAQSEATENPAVAGVPVAPARTRPDRTQLVAKTTPEVRPRKQLAVEVTGNESLPTPDRLALRQPANLPVQNKTSAAPTAPDVIEVVILKDDTTPALAMAPAAPAGEEEPAEEEESVKGKVVKGLLHQVRNLATGKKVELPDLNPNNYSIAFETQIGNRKISKTIKF